MADIVTLAFRIIADTISAQRNLQQITQQAQRTGRDVSAANSILARSFESAEQAQKNFARESANAAQTVNNQSIINGLAARQFTALMDASKAAGLTASAGTRTYNLFFEAIKQAAASGDDPGWAKLGLNVSQALAQPAKAFKEFLALFDKLGENKKDFGSLLLGPRFSQVEGFITGLRQNLSGFVSDSAGVAGAAESTGAALGEVGKAAGAAGSEVAGAGAAAEGAGGAMAAAAGPAGILAAVLVALAAAAVATSVGLFSVTERAAKNGAKIQDLADRTGTSVGRVQALVRAAQETGLGFEQSTDVISRSLDRFVSNIDKAGSTTGRTAQTFKQFGVDAKEGIKDVNPALDQVISKLGGMTSATQQSAKAQEFFGQKNEQIALILQRVGPDLAAYIAEMERLGGKVTPEATKAAKSFEDSQSRLSIAAGGIANVIGGSLIPIFQPLLDLLTQVLVLVRQGAEFFFPELAKRLSGVALAFDLLNATLRSGPQLFALFKAVVTDSGVAVARLIGIVQTGSQALAAFFSGDFIQAGRLANLVAQQTRDLTSGLTKESTKALDNLAKAVATNYGKILDERQRVTKRSRETDLADIDASKKAREQALNNEIATLRRREEEVDRSAKSELASAKRVYEGRAISLEQFEALSVDAEERLFAVKRALFEEERQLITRNATLFTSEERTRRLEEVRKRELDAELRLEDAREKVRAERVKREDETFKRVQEIRLKASDVSDKEEIERLRSQAERRVITFESAERQIADIQQAGFERRRLFLEAEEVIAGKNEEQLQKVRSSIELLNEESAKASTEASIRIQEAQIKDLRTLDQFLVSRRKILEESETLRIEILRQEAQTERQRAEFNPNARVESVQREIEAELTAAQVRHQIALRRIEDERLIGAQQAGANPALIEETERRSHAARLAEDRRFATERAAIEQRGTDVQARRDSRRAELQEELQLELQVAEERHRIKLEQIAEERTLAIEEAGTNTRLVEEAERRSRSRRIEEEQRFASQKEAIQKKIQIAEEQPSSRREAIRLTLEADLAAAETRHQLVLRQIEEEKNAAEQAAGPNRTLLEEAERLSNERRLAEEERFQNERRALRQRATIDEQQLDPSSNLSIFGTLDEGQSRLAAFGQTAATVLGQVSQSAGNMKSILSGAFSQISSGLQTMIQNFILTGQTGPAALKKLAAGAIAALASQSLVKALFETAEGFAQLAIGNVPSATLHFKAAGIYAAVGAIAGGVAAAISAGGGAGAGAGAAGGAGSTSAGAFAPQAQRDLRVSRGNAFDQTAAGVRETVNEGNTGPFGLFKQLADQLETFNRKFNTARPGDVLVAGAAERPDAIADATIRETNRNAGFTRELGLNLGLT